MTNWEKRTTEVQDIMKKYGKNYSRLNNEATRKEFKTVIKWVADSANRKQREIVGLPNKD